MIGLQRLRRNKAEVIHAAKRMDMGNRRPLSPSTQRGTQHRFANRIGVYLALMDDRYPSTDDGQSVALDFPYPDAKQGLSCRS